MKFGYFSALLFCTALLLSGCGARETQEPAENLPPAKAAFTRESRIEDVKNDPVFGSYGRLLFPLDNYYYSGDTLENLQLTYYSHIDPDETVEIVNTLRERAADEKTDCTSVERCARTQPCRLRLCQQTRIQRQTLQTFKCSISGRRTMSQPRRSSRRT